MVLKTIYQGVPEGVYRADNFRSFVESLGAQLNIWFSPSCVGIYYLGDVRIQYTNYRGTPAECSISLEGLEDKVSLVERLFLTEQKPKAAKLGTIKI